MAIPKELLVNELTEIVVNTGFKKELIVKDYYLTILLYVMKDIKGLYFKRYCFAINSS
ncbi:hypothetical protein K9M74_04860 [Candidatus Woesearchaeota archaeon]|nr:hypothetical protein [Candidatus Woesearchaeota archaeon]